jgi:thioredoxin 1
MSTLAVTDDSFENDVLKADRPVLVDFWAEWCGPCKQISPTLDQIASEQEGRLTIAKLNIDDNLMTPGRYSVRGIPTLMIFKDGKLASTKSGTMSKSRIEDWLRETGVL